MVKKFFLWLLISIFSAALFLYYVAFTSNVLRTTEMIVEPGTGIDKLADQLAPVLKHKKTFLLTAKLKRFKRPMPGKYHISANSTNNDLINLLRSGRQTQVELIFNNIPSLSELAGKVSRVIAPDSLAILTVMKDENFLKAKGFTIETALLMYIPNTYKFYYFTSPEIFRERMWKEYRRFWNKTRSAKAKRLNLSPVEVGILASIVQKETNIPAEKPVIAGVYLNRLRRGMKLQADPTVVFAYRKATGDTTVIRRVLNKHLAIDNPYNTYMYSGLPPGPITMPDISTIDAVLNAEQHDYLYFVADPANPGHHLFAKTLSEHQRNAARYRSLLNRRKIMK